MGRGVALFGVRLADVMLSPWLTLGYNAHWLWHKTKKPDHDYYYNCEDGLLRVKLIVDDFTLECMFMYCPVAAGTANAQCYNCWSWSGLYGPIRFFRMHHLLRPWMLDVKLSNFNRTDGCSCSMVSLHARVFNVHPLAPR